jgi:hypothetical protein
MQNSVTAAAILGGSIVVATLLWLGSWHYFPAGNGGPGRLRPLTGRMQFITIDRAQRAHWTDLEGCKQDGFEQVVDQ